MKIGLSYSRCVRDIVDGKVDIDDVLIIISRTDFDPRDPAQWRPIWSGYGGGDTNGIPLRGILVGTALEWLGYEDKDEVKFRDISIQLWNDGKLHQPRKFGTHPRRMPYIWLETVLVESDLDNNIAAKQAWEQFQLLAGLSGVMLNNRAH